MLMVSAAAHFSSFFLDPMAAFPGVMLIHLAIFPPFVATIVYANRTAGTGKACVDKVRKCAPMWLQGMAAGFFVYAFVNFAVFIYRSQTAR